MTGRVPFALPFVGEEEVEAVAEVLRSGWLTSGPKAQAFEQAFAERFQVKHALAVSSCTAALHLALEAVGVGPGDRVVTTALTFAATAEPIRYLGAEPVFADIAPTTLNLDPEAVRRACREQEGRVKAIVPVHFAGLACDMDGLRTVADEFGAALVEDAAHALGADWRGEPIAGGSSAACFSFYATKGITTGEGGMLTTNDDAIAERVAVMRLHGLSKTAWNRYAKGGQWRYQIVDVGYKYNLPDVLAAIGLVQLRLRMEDMIASRTRVAQRYQQAFAGHPALIPAPDHGQGRHVWHLYTLQLNLDRLVVEHGGRSVALRDRIVDELREAGLGVAVNYVPLHQHPFWQNRLQLSDELLPETAKVGERLISLPLYPGMDSNQVEHVITTVLATVERYLVTKTS